MLVDTSNCFEKRGADVNREYPVYYIFYAWILEAEAG